MDDSEIAEKLSDLSETVKIKVLDRLKEIGVENSSDLCDVEVEDLTKDGLLKLIQARKLVKNWRKEEKKQGKIIFKKMKRCKYNRTAVKNLSRLVKDQSLFES